MSVESSSMRPDLTSCQTLRPASQPASPALRQLARTPAFACRVPKVDTWLPESGTRGGSGELVRNLGPDVGGVVVVGAVDLPADTGSGQAFGGTPSDHGVVGGAEVGVRSIVDGRGHPAGRQRGGDDAAGQRARPAQLDADLHGRRVV